MNEMTILGAIPYTFIVELSKFQILNLINYEMYYRFGNRWKTQIKNVYGSWIKNKFNELINEMINSKIPKNYLNNFNSWLQTIF